MPLYGSRYWISNGGSSMCFELVCVIVRTCTRKRKRLIYLQHLNCAIGRLGVITVTRCRNILAASIVLSVVVLIPSSTLMKMKMKNQVDVPSEYGPYAKIKVYSKVRVFPQGGEESTNKPPWDMPDITIHDSLDFLSSSDRAIVGNISFSPGQGNIMFQYAALLALAHMYKAHLLISSKTPLRRAFNLSSSYLTPNLTNELVQSWNRTVLVNCCQYYSVVETLSVQRHTFFAYFQSYRYFHPHYASLIKKEFTFLPMIKDMAVNIINEAQTWIREKSGNACAAEFVYIGMHIRRGIDLTWNLRNVEHGHTAAPAKYYKQAMKYFTDQFGTNCTAFLVATDNVRWTKDLVADADQNNMNVYLVESGTREVDMAVLTNTNHTIMSQGTFSWWIAYLTGGQVVYHNGWPRPGSTMDKMLNKTDYFLPHWKGLH